MRGSPPAIEIMGAPHSSPDSQHSSGVRRLRRISVGYWILPQPAHSRLQAKSGSSIMTRGYFSTPLIFWATRYFRTDNCICHGEAMSDLLNYALSADAYSL